MEETLAFPQISLIKYIFPDPTVETAGKYTIFGCVRVFTSILVVIVGG